MIAGMAFPDSLHQKIFRAFEHLKELEAETARYYQTKPGRVVRQKEGSPNEYIGRIVTDGPIPARIPLIVGDCLQNLRSSLDYLIWELVFAANNTPSQKNMFPICSTPEFFDEQLRRGRLSGVSVDAIAEIKRLQPYHIGQNASRSVITVIDDLCNVNKHRRILLTHLQGGMAPPDFITKEEDGITWGLVDLAAMHQSDAKIGPYPIVDGPQGRGLQMDMQPHIIAFIAFNEGATQNMHVCVVLTRMIEYVKDTIFPLFERFF